MSQQWKDAHDANKPVVTPEHVAEVVSTMTGIPTTKIIEKIKDMKKTYGC